MQVDESFERSSKSLGWKGSSRRVSFKDFDDSNAFALADPEKRQRYIEDFVAEIKDTMSDFMAHYQNDTRGTIETSQSLEDEPSSLPSGT